LSNPGNHEQGGEQGSHVGAVAGPRKTSRKARHRDQENQLKQRILDLEAEVEEFKANEDAKLYGLTPEVERAVARAIDEENGRRLYRLIRPLHPADFADLIERYSGDQRRLLVTIVGRFFDPDILAELDETVREEIIPYLGDEILALAVAALPSDDAVEVLGELDEADQERVLRAIPERDRALVEEALSYVDESAGRLMQGETVSVPRHWTVGQTIDFLRTFKDLPDDFYDIFVIDPERRPLGKLALSHLLRSKRPILVADIMQARFHSVLVHMDQEDVA
jgi:magnesium transporter